MFAAYEGGRKGRGKKGKQFLLLGSKTKLYRTAGEPGPPARERPRKGPSEEGMEAATDSYIQYSGGGEKQKQPYPIANFSGFFSPSPPPLSPLESPVGDEGLLPS